VWLKPYSSCFASVKPLVKTQVPQKKKKKEEKREKAKKQMK
jgi:hypothetical protein